MPPKKIGLTTLIPQYVLKADTGASQDIVNLKDLNLRLDSNLYMPPDGQDFQDQEGVPLNQEQTERWKQMVELKRKQGGVNHIVKDQSGGVTDIEVEHPRKTGVFNKVYGNLQNQGAVDDDEVYEEGVD